MLRELHLVRQQLIGDIRASDVAAAKRADELLARLREDREGGE
jgi:hypothetical protein